MMGEICIVFVDGFCGLGVLFLLVFFVDVRDILIELFWYFDNID